jgi:ferrous iron transport protein B
MLKNVVLVGQPNSGKTTLFNSLTGGKYKTGNYPGVTVDYAIGELKSRIETTFSYKIYDTPGINSLFPHSKDEEIAVNGLIYNPKFNKADLVLSIVDVNQLSRQLFLSKQLIDAGFRVLIVLTMADLFKKKFLKIKTDEISDFLGVPVIFSSGKDTNSVNDLVYKVDDMLQLEIEDKNIERKEMSSEEVIQLFKDLSNLAEKSVEVDIECIGKYNKVTKNDLSQKIDKVVLNPFFGFAIFSTIMILLFSSIFWLASPFMDLIDSSFSELAGFTEQALGDTWYSDFFSNGVISGIGAVLVFLPQIVILFFVIGLLEDSGYLSRAAVIIDYPLSKIGLSGRSFVPLLSGYACAIPALMAARTIKSSKERFITLFIIPLMSCSARLPVYSLLLAFIFTQNQSLSAGLALFVIYLFSLVVAILIAAIISKFSKLEESGHFALELPSYKMPNFSTLFHSVLKKAKAYLVDAGTIILLISILMWFFSNYPKEIDQNGNDVTNVEHSFLGQAGQLLTPALEPMDLDWRCGVAILASFAAREVFVSAMLQVFHLDEDADEESIQKSLLSTMRSAKKSGTDQKLFRLSTIAGLIVFYMFALMCFPTISIAKREFASAKLAIIQFLFFSILAYILSIMTVHLFDKFS